MDVQKVLESLPERKRKSIERIIERTALEEIERLAKRWSELNTEIEQADQEKKKIKPSLVGLVSGMSPETQTVWTKKVKVNVVPLAPRREVDSKEFLGLLKSLTDDPDLFARILAACIDVRVNEAMKLFQIHFGKEAVEQLSEITTEKPQGPRLLVELLSQKEEK